MVPDPLIADRRLLIGRMDALGRWSQNQQSHISNHQFPLLSFLFFNIAAIFLNTEFFLLSESSV
jgi:hypothetical protein